MSNQTSLSAEAKADLMRAAVFEAACIGFGVTVYFLTASWIWIVIGLLAGLGFSLPAIIKLVREKEENNHAPR